MEDTLLYGNDISQKWTSKKDPITYCCPWYTYSPMFHRKVCRWACGREPVTGPTTANSTIPCLLALVVLKTPSIFDRPKSSPKTGRRTLMNSSCNGRRANIASVDVLSCGYEHFIEQCAGYGRAARRVHCACQEVVLCVLIGASSSCTHSQPPLHPLL